MMSISFLGQLKRIAITVFAFFQVFCISNHIYIDFGGTHGLRADFAYDFAYSTEKIDKRQLLGYDKTHVMYLAKNEYEACQFVVRPRYVSRGSYKVTVSDFTDENGNKLPHSVYEVRYVNKGSSAADYVALPDPLVPYKGAAVVAAVKENRPFYIEVHSSTDTVPGKYTANITVCDAENNETVYLNAKVSAVIWNFALPESFTSDTAMGLGGGQFYTLNGVTPGTPEANKVYKMYYDFLLERGVSAYSLPYDILSPEADAYMSDPRVKSFMIPYVGDDALLQRYYAKVTSNEVWAKKAFFYPIDEPSDAEAYERYNQITERLARLCPGYNMVTPFNTDSVTISGKEYSSVSLQDGKSNIMCAISELFDDNDTFINETNARKNNGDKSWWYVCCGPSGDYCNMFTTNEGIRHRILFWQQKDFGIQGLLYWSTSYWDKCGNPWVNPTTWDTSSIGDGSWLYPSRDLGLNEPIGSLRLFGVTNGLEDFEYLTIAENLFGKDYVNETISKVTKSMTKYETSDKQFDKVRTALGEAIAAEMSK